MHIKNWENQNISKIGNIFLQTFAINGPISLNTKKDMAKNAKKKFKSSINATGHCQMKPITRQVDTKKC